MQPPKKPTFVEVAAEHVQLPVTVAQQALRPLPWKTLRAQQLVVAPRVHQLQRHALLRVSHRRPLGGDRAQRRAAGIHRVEAAEEMAVALTAALQGSQTDGADVARTWRGLTSHFRYRWRGRGADVARTVPVTPGSVK